MDKYEIPEETMATDNALNRFVKEKLTDVLSKAGVPDNDDRQRTIKRHVYAILSRTAGLVGRDFTSFRATLTIDIDTKGPKSNWRLQVTLDHDCQWPELQATARPTHLKVVV